MDWLIGHISHISHINQNLNPMPIILVFSLTIQMKYDVNSLALFIWFPHCQFHHTV